LNFLAEIFGLHLHALFRPLVGLGLRLSLTSFEGNILAVEQRMHRYLSNAGTCETTVVIYDWFVRHIGLLLLMWHKWLPFSS